MAASWPQIPLTKNAGLQRGGIPNGFLLDITHEDYREANWALVTELLEGNESSSIEKQYRRKRQLVWVRNNVSWFGHRKRARLIMALSEDIN